jgi:type IV pilus assembly protein PilY1
MTQQQFRINTRRLTRGVLLTLGALSLAIGASAQITDIAQVPLVTASSTAVKPNLMVVVDDSGSMASNFMPDDASQAKLGASAYGFYAAQCNGLAYNPSINYARPVDATGAQLVAGTFAFPSAASLNNLRTITSPASPSMATGSIIVTLGSGTSGSYSVGKVVTLYSSTTPSQLMVGSVTAWNSTTRQLTVNVTSLQGSGSLSSPEIGDGDNRPYFYNYTGAEPKLSYTYNSTGVITTTTFYLECSSSFGNTPGSNVFTKVVVTPFDATLQNYANWYTYYRTRILMMKSAASLAFQPIGDNYRIGFTTISSKTVDGSNFLDLTDFDATQKGLFYTQLSGLTPGPYTPLRGALSKAGHYFAKKGVKANGTAQTYDPVQYSCQRNYALMTTDGYWNSHDETAAYGPYKLDGGLVGQQDGSGTPPPMNDGQSSGLEAQTSTLQQQTTTPQFTTSTRSLQQRTITPIFTTVSSQLQQRTINPLFTTTTSLLQQQTITPKWTTVSSPLQQRSITPQWTKASSPLQQRSITAQWTTSTSRLERITGQLQVSTSADSGVTWTTWTNAASCTWKTTGGTTRTKCQYAWGAATNPGSCTVSYSTVTTGGTVWSGNGTKCQYGAPIITTPTTSCSAVAPSPGPTNYTVSTAVSCTALADVYGAWTNTATCTASATVGCQYGAPVVTTPTTSCAVVAPSPGPTNFTVGTAVSCTALATIYGSWTNTATCTASATVGCQYGAATTTTTTSCTLAAPSPGPTNYTVGTAVSSCTDLTTYGTWTNAASCTTSPTNGCRYNAPVNTSTTSCTPKAPSAGSPYTVAAAVSCTDLTTYGAWTNAASCTASSTNGCQYAAPVTTTTSSCSLLAPSPGPTNYTVGTAVSSCTDLTTYGAWTNAPTCTVSSTNGCQYATAVNTTTTSCTAVAASPGPTNYTVGTSVSCTTLPNLVSAWTNTTACNAVTGSVACRYTSYSAWAPVASCTSSPQSTGPAYVGPAINCQTTSNGGSTDSLADVAMYYYKTDLRNASLSNCTSTVNGNPIDVCNDNVSPSGADTAAYQHMQTFTVGLGVSGYLHYQTDYKTATSGDFYNITQGTTNWPLAVENTASAVDDLWHAAVNGRGTYFSAGDPQALSDNLTQTLASIQAITGFGSAAAASTLQPVQGDNSLFLAKYVSAHWLGDLLSYTIDPVTGVITGPVWSAAAKLQATVNAGTARNIYYSKRNSGANTGALRSFTYANLLADGLNASFDNSCTKSPALTQCTSSGYDTVTANLGSNMVNYLRGGSHALYRARVTNNADIPGGIIGDVIGGAPVYVGRPPFKYVENNYPAFVSSVNTSNAGAGRPGVVYFAANDGMLHAIDGASGDEKWAYVPSMVMDKMYILADKDYPNRHEFLVDGAPIVGDIYVPGATPTWKTILVGGLGAGGRGYYALDITNPNNPIALWEFTNDSLGGNNTLGLTFGNPVITKRADGTWVVVFSSGYNNVSPGDGNGHLFMVNANTGQRVLDSGGVNPLDIATFTSGTTPAGTSATPSGLAKINAWIDSEIDNTATRFYGADLLGNVWRFDTDNLVAPHQAALRLAYLSAGGVAQPVSTQPALAKITYGGTGYPVVYVATGKYLGTTDLATTATQSVYALKDPLTNTPLGDAHASTSVVAQTMSQASANAPLTITNLPVDWSTKSGWRVDLLAAGERVNVNMQIIYNTLDVAGNIPSVDVCTVGGSSNFYQFDIATGSARSSFSGGAVGQWQGNSMIVGFSTFTLQAQGGAAGSGDTVSQNVTSRGFGSQPKDPDPVPVPPGNRRTSWRELVN